VPIYAPLLADYRNSPTHTKAHVQHWNNEKCFPLLVHVYVCVGDIKYYTFFIYSIYAMFLQEQSRNTLTQGRKSESIGKGLAL